MVPAPPRPAVSIAGAGASLGIAGMAPLSDALIAQCGWRRGGPGMQPVPEKRWGRGLVHAPYHLRGSTVSGKQ